jgi:hypothetical protein
MSGRILLHPRWSLRVYAGLTADFRIILTAEDLNEQDMEEANRHTESTISYFWGQGRWIFPVSGIGVDFTAAAPYLIGLDARVWFPLYRLWSDETLPSIEGWRFGISIRVTKSIRAKST